MPTLGTPNLPPSGIAQTWSDTRFTLSCTTNGFGVAAAGAAACCAIAAGAEENTIAV
jgi:hypothetical protein